ncbi:MAG: cytochrome c biogenesis protein CcsA [Bacteroidota bacterium]|nr:cytochrome c biogenesis protein CcsA [Bacteroidota bacterium]MDP4234073.1 cytochrome c biogenesis protein CcsA [Bacteroidota bacterium]MDP4243014.1 cytochrome c biogenesis protein CcsA [Bacteroidota bacterium]MDP4287440.1 cytochrome c biogenesis protein CcsA [Bacteroidota bacterium]
MRLFRSNLFLWCLGIALAIQVYIAFETPIGGSFSDATTLAMNGVQDVTPVRATLVSTDSAGALFKDLYGEPGRVHASNGAYGAYKAGDVLVISVAYNLSAKSFNLVEIIRANPMMTFPMIQGLGELGRNMLFHVPMAMVAFIAFLVGTIYSILFLIKKDFEYDRHARAASAAGLLFTILATVTGSIWARFSWGTFWNWDPRETSIFILLLIYAAYFMLRSLLEESEDKKARIAAVYNIIAFVSVPFLMFVVPRITQSLHPGGGGTEAPVINLSGQTHTDRTLLDMHWISVVLFLFVFFWIKDMYTRILRLEAKRAEDA